MLCSRVWSSKKADLLNKEVAEVQKGGPGAVKKQVAGGERGGRATSHGSEDSPHAQPAGQRIDRADPGKADRPGHGERSFGSRGSGPLDFLSSLHRQGRSFSQPTRGRAGNVE